MKIQILQENLNKALSTTTRSVSSRVQLPILSNVLLKTDNGRLQIVTTNLETSTCVWVGAKVEKEGEITVPARVLTDIVASLTPGKVDLKVETTALTINTGYYEASINGIPAAEFPVLPAYDEKKLFTAPIDLLVNTINQIVFAAATDEGRPVLTGVMIISKEKDLSMIATDGYRLSLKTVVPEENTGGEYRMIVPAKTLVELQRIVGEYKGDQKTIRFGYTKEQNQVVFILGEVTLFSRLIDGEFPDYQKIIPKEHKTRLTFEGADLNRAVKLASVFSRDSANIVKLKTEGDKLEVSANSPQVGENKAMIEVKFEGEPLEIAFNYRFIQGLLGAVGEGEMVFEASGSLSPGAFKLTEDKDFLHVIMPVRLQTEGGNE